MNAKNIKVGIPKNVKVMGLASLFNDISSEIIYPFLPIFFTETLKASVSFFGLIEGVAESTASILKLFSGWLSDTLRSRKPLGLTGYLLSSISRPLLAIAMSPWQGLLIRFSDRFGKGIRTAPRDTLIADSCNENQLGRSFGFHRALDNAGAVGGPLIAALFLGLGFSNLRMLFWIATIPSLLCVLTFGFLVTEKKPSSTRALPSFSLKPFSSKFKKYLMIAFVFALANSSDTFLLLRAKSLGESLLGITFLWAMINAVRVLSAWRGGILSDVLGRTPLIITGWVLYGLVYLGFGLCQQSWLLWVLFAVYGAFSGLTEGAEKAFVADLVPANLRGTAYGLYNLSLGLAALPASYLMGLLWQYAGVFAAFSVTSLLAFLAALLLYFLPKQ